MTDSPAPRGCSRHLLLIAALFAVALGVVLARNWGGVGRTVANMRAMQQGSDAARALDSPDALLDWIAAHPEQASLVVLDVADPDGGLDVWGDVVRPVAGLPTLLLLAEAARSVEVGALSAAPLGEDVLDVRRLPGTGAPPDPRAGDLLAQVLADRAAESELLDRIGMREVRRGAQRLGLDALEPPVPYEGMLLAWGERAAEMEHGEAVAEAYRLAERLASSATYRAEVVERLQNEGFPLGLDAQRAAAATTLPRGTAEGYARLFTLALRDSLYSPAVSDRFLHALDQTPPDSLGSAFAALGTRGGGVPGFLTLAAFARTEAHPEGRVAVLVFEDLPLAVFYHLVQTRLDSVLVLNLLADEAAVAQAQARLGAGGGA